MHVHLVYVACNKITAAGEEFGNGSDTNAVGCWVAGCNVKSVTDMLMRRANTHNCFEAIATGYL